VAAVQAGRRVLSRQALPALLQPAVPSFPFPGRHMQIQIPTVLFDENTSLQISYPVTGVSPDGLVKIKIEFFGGRHAGSKYFIK